jgi:hypothetical protein
MTQSLCPFPGARTGERNLLLDHLRRVAPADLPRCVSIQQGVIGVPDRTIACAANNKHTEEAVQDISSPLTR